MIRSAAGSSPEAKKVALQLEKNQRVCHGRFLGAAGSLKAAQRFWMDSEPRACMRLE
tara:strand:- start:2084 stop:2254 length:171 start_codon:yes stop_codon:yes gene_type:complete